MSTGRLPAFLSMILAIWVAMHVYVFWRLSSVPLVASHLSRRGLVVLAVVLAGAYPLSRWLSSLHWNVVALPLEFVGALWIGILFLIFSSLLVTEVLTLGGLLLPRLVPALRGWAMALALLLSVVGVIQALRPPVLRDYEVRLPGLPPERDGLTLVQVSDLHLGSLLGERWLQRLVARVNVLGPDAVVVVGDLVDGSVDRVEPFLPVLKSLRAPLGVWAVTGNHEFYAGLERSVRLFEEAGYTVLRDRSAEVVPGLVLAGVDDLTARRQYRLPDHPLEKALGHRPAGAAILLSHSPLESSRAAGLGANLMLSGHTHAGQVWPFGYVIRQFYRLLGGCYQEGSMPVIVCRGTGTWGPRLRLWWPSEIVRIRLRAPG